jgi:UDP-N-acetylglucosamine 4,6-dehydratase
MINWEEQSILITGGTGFLGKHLTKILFNQYKPNKLIIFSRDELKQSEMHQIFGEEHYPSIRYFIGDVRDRDRLYRAFDGVDIVIHLAGTNDLSSGEYNPFETVKTNILGAMNIIDAAIDRNVKKVIALSCGMVVNPIHLSGITNLYTERLFVTGNNYSGVNGTRFSVVRLGSILGGRNSFITNLLKTRETGGLTIPEIGMTRFLFNPDQAVSFLITVLELMFGGEIFIPKMPSVNITNVAKVIAPECKISIADDWPYERPHEVLLTEDDSRFSFEYENYFAIIPVFLEKGALVFLGPSAGIPCYSGFRYSSDSNTQWLSVEDLQEMIKQMGTEKPG